MRPGHPRDLRLRRKEIAGSRFGFKGEEQGMAGPDDYIDKPVDRPTFWRGSIGS